MESIQTGSWDSTNICFNACTTPTECVWHAGSHCDNDYSFSDVLDVGNDPAVSAAACE